MVKKIIALVGYNGSGKTTTAHLIHEYLIKNCYTAEVKSFADPVRYLTEKYLNIDKHINRDLVEEFAQELKMFDKQIYAKYLLNSIDENCDYIIIDDLRFEEELIALYNWVTTKEIKLVNIHIERDITPSESDAKRFEQFIHSDLQVQEHYIDIYNLNTSDNEEVFLENFDTLIAKILNW